MIKNPYKVLGVDINAPKDECKRAYRKLCARHHPDVGGDPDVFLEINQAWDMINSGKYVSPVKKRNSLRHQTLFSFV